MWNLEHTDTFGGEANYCWVRRDSITGQLTDRQVIRKAKAFAGFTGLRCRVDNMGDMIQITPVGRHRLLQTVFATWDDA